MGTPELSERVGNGPSCVFGLVWVLRITAKSSIFYRPSFPSSDSLYYVNTEAHIQVFNYRWRSDHSFIRYSTPLPVSHHIGVLAHSLYRVRLMYVVFFETSTNGPMLSALGLKPL